MKLRKCSDGAANRGMGRAIGDPVPKALPRSYTIAWDLAWAGLRRAIMDLPLSLHEKERIYAHSRWTVIVQQGFPDTLAAFAAMSDEELDASLALMRDVKPWAFWVAACECMLREYEVSKGMRDTRVTDREEQPS